MRKSGKKKGTGNTVENLTNDSGFPIVGIGASAGGLEAIEELLGKIKPFNDYAILLVTHMKPDQKSMLPEILASKTEIPVFEAVENQEINAGSIYIIPPNTYLTVNHGRIKLEAMEKRETLRLPIDTLFKSLARECGKAAICVILSGSGSDGSVGLKSIKEQGGMIIAQDPKSAKFDNMPKSAIHTGLVDMVLVPNEIPEQINRYVSHLNNLAKPGIADSLQSENSNDLAKIIGLLKENTRCDFTNYKPSTLARRIEKRLYINNCNSIQEYLSFLNDDDDESIALYESLLISVTSFFRDSDVFKHLADDLVPEFFTNRNKNEPLRIWCAGCATGEEAYSIAITVHEYLRTTGKHFPVQIFATDINSSSIIKARSGIFSEGIRKEINTELLQRYFTHLSGFYKISSEVRDSIIFAPHNLLNDPPFYDLDLVCCRNLLIYLLPSAQEKVFSLFYNSLKEKGLLLLGKSESLGRFSDCFKPASANLRTFKRISGLDRPNRKIVAGIWNEKNPIVNRHNRISENYFSRFLEKHLIRNHTPPAILINSKMQILYFHGDTAAYLRDPEGSPTDNIVDRAAPGVKRQLRSALLEAIREKKNVALKAIGIDEIDIEISVELVKTEDSDEILFSVAFVEKPGIKINSAESDDLSGDEKPLVLQLKNDLKILAKELENTLEDSRVTTEQLNGSNQELLAMNEELQSSNEELASSKEELQALNEELTIVNLELNRKIEELHNANSDINNILDSSNIPFVVLDIDLRIRHFTPNIEQVFHIIPSDKGRAIDHIVSRLVNVDFRKDCEDVLKTLDFKETEVVTDQGRIYLKRIFPFKNKEHHLDGLIITFSEVTEIKKAHEELAAHKNELEKLVEERTSDLKFSEKLLKETGQLAMVGGWELDWENKTVFWTDATYSIFEVETDYDSSLKSALEFFLPEYRKAVKDALNECSKNGTPYDLELKIITNKGNSKWIRTIGKLRSEKPKVIGGSVMDITDFHNTKSDYESTLTRLKEAQSIAQVGDWEWNIAEDKVTWSDELYRLMELDPLSAPPNYAGNLAFYHPDDAKVLDEAVSKAATDGDSFEVELRRIRPDGPDFIFLSRGLARKDDSGKITHLYGTVLDITDRKKQQKELVHQHKKLKAVLENTTDAFFEVDNNFKVVEINERALPILGITLEDIQGKILWDVFPEAIDTQFDKEYNRAISDKTTVDFEEYFEPLNSWFEVHAYPHQDGLSVYFRDISDRKENELKLRMATAGAEAANQAKSEFIANMSHEIRTPLNGIQGSLQLLRFTQLDEDQSDLLDISETASSSLLTIIDDILDLSRIESGKVEIRNEPLDFNLLIKSLHAIFDLRVAEKNLKLSVLKHSDVPDTVMGDISRIRQILVNLIGNSVKFTNKGSIHLEIKRLNVLANNQLKIGISVTDTGIGIEDELTANLFEPFVQGRKRLSGKAKGTGLGLSIVKRLVDMMGGEIHMEKATDGGTYVNMEFPFDKFTSKAPKKITSDAKIEITQPAKAIKILVAEDDFSNSTVMRKMLTLLGYECCFANDGQEALAILKSTDIDIILMDLQMPIMDGYETTKKIRQDKEFSDKSGIPIIALTAHAMDVYKNKALDEGMNDFLTKPVMMESLKKLLEKYTN